MGHLQLGDGAHLPHHHAEHHLAGAVDVALFHRLRRGDRDAHLKRRGRQLRRLHRPRPDHAVAAHPEHLERLDRHLLPEVHRHHLRNPVGAGVLSRDRHQLCRRRRHQIGDARPHHPGDGRLLRAVACRAPAGDDPLPGAHRGHLLAVRLHHRHLGGRLREAADRAAPDHHAAHLPRRQLLFDQDAAARCGRR